MSRASSSGGGARSSPCALRVVKRRSPAGSTKIPETEVVTPSTRLAPQMSTRSLTRLSSTRSPNSSSPTGPQKRARPPSRVIAIAALAALPPPVKKNSRAIAFVLGVGKRSTRNMKSSTAIPAHRTSGAAGLPPLRGSNVLSFWFTGQAHWGKCRAGTFAAITLEAQGWRGEQTGFAARAESVLHQPVLPHFLDAGLDAVQETLRER